MGTCVATFKCKASVGGGQGGQGGGDMGGLMQALGQLMQALKPKEKSGGQGSGGGDSSGAGMGATSNYGGCQGQYFQTSDITQLSNPCAQYVAPVSDSITGSSECDALSAALGICTEDSSDGGGETGNEDATGTSSVGQSTSSERPPRLASSTSLLFQGLSPVSGSSGDITTGGGGATAVAGATDAESNVTVAGFYGAESGAGGQGLIARWCQSRPWASNFLSSIVPPSFFDGLCSLRGYQVGAPPPPSASYSQQPKAKKPSAPATTAPTTTTPVIPPKADIWASPTSVPLGARTSIFWNASGVTSCKETSSDGSFDQKSFSGGAATVPLTGATTFTIVCVAPDGTEVKDTVRVNLSI